MMKFGLLGAAAVVACTLAAPAMAQQVFGNPGRCAQFGTCQNYGPGYAYGGGDYQRRAGYRADRDWSARTEGDYGWNNNGWNDNGWHDQGFWPAEAAAGIVGGAIATGAAIATAPIRANANAYAWDNGNRGGWTDAYMKRNGFVCRPGTWFKGQDGLQHICQ